jgi:two-component system, OmpR family, sensor histidine kinase SenX3
MQSPTEQPGAPRQSLDMSTFLASSTHEMKNSISIMTAYLETALQDTPPGEDAGFNPQELTRRALAEAKWLNNRLVQILALYKVNMGLYPFDPNEVELTGFATEVMARVQPLADTKGIELELEISGGDHLWTFDYELILGVVAQVLHNAVKYTNDRIRLSLCANPEYLEIRVADNGAGYPQFMLDHGYATRQAVDAKTGNTGLGLHFATLAVNLHHSGEHTGSTLLENGGDLGGGQFALRLPRLG